MKPPVSVDLNFLSLRLFALSWAILCGGTAYYLYQCCPEAWNWLLPLVAALGFVGGLVKPAVLRPVYKALTHLLSPVGHVMSLLFLALAYFTIFTAYARVLVWLGRDALQLRLTAQGRSGWHQREHHGELDRYYRQF